MIAAAAVAMALDNYVSALRLKHVAAALGMSLMVLGAAAGAAQASCSQQSLDTVHDLLDGSSLS